MSTCAGTVIVRASIAAATAISSRASDYGIVTLAISVTGRNPASSGSFAGVDYPDLAPA